MVLRQKHLFEESSKRGVTVIREYMVLGFVMVVAFTTLVDATLEPVLVLDYIICKNNSVGD